jgi:hypothetical protein
MGVVYKARQPKLNRLVALKLLAPERGGDPRFAERFEREAQALARLNHPNIVTVHDFGMAGGRYYLLMEFVDGTSLRQLLKAGSLAPEQALAIVPRICEALQYAHDKGVVHRDIKPENVLLNKEGCVKIADFGIAKIIAPGGGARALTQDDQVIGTPHYMAPEQVENPGRVDHRADIYSLGVVFYEMLTGELPLGKFAPPSRKVHVDVRLDEVVLHALEREPDRRYQHASEVKTDVESISVSDATRRSWHSTPSGPLAAHPWLVLLAGLPFLGGIAFGIRWDQPLLGAAGWAGCIGCLVVFFTLRRQGPQGVAARPLAEPGQRKAEQDAAEGSARTTFAAQATETSPDRSASRVPSPNALVRAGQEQSPFFNSLFLLFIGFFWTVVGLKKELPGVAAVGCGIVFAGTVWALWDAIRLWQERRAQSPSHGPSLPDPTGGGMAPNPRNASDWGYWVVAALVVVECGFIATWVMTGTASWLAVTAISSAVWGVASHIGTVAALEKRGVQVKYPLLVPLMPISYMPQYRAMTLQESGRIGPLFYSYVLANGIALVSGIAFIVVLHPQ